ncbi:MAG: hypothetical protein LBS56_11160, partial [Propionibacteriaceae bacterium]|nr:hypothetical protein [Propionibacteriaceae bacterium]
MNWAATDPLAPWPSPLVMADSSVWIDYLGEVDGPQVARLERAVAEGLVLVGDFILTEVLRGIRDDRTFTLTCERMLAFVSTSVASLIAQQRHQLVGAHPLARPPAQVVDHSTAPR